MAVDKRKNAATMPAAEFENFLKACVLLKNKLVPSTTFSEYDRWVALHACAVMVQTPGATVSRNLAHGNIGFLPWHREYLRRFELALQTVVPGVTIPYWPWPITPEPSTLFSNARIHRIFFSSNSPQDVGGLFASTTPSSPPVWWPTGFRWRIPGPLQGPVGSTTLIRGSSNDNWPPTSTNVNDLEALNVSASGSNPYWAFWRRLEAGDSVMPISHNTGHNIVGGYMSNPIYSPNDPLFWLHHAYIDRIWSRWQSNRMSEQIGSTRLSHYPRQTEGAPATGIMPPNGHRRDDFMWPWVGTTPGYTSTQSSSVQAMLPNFSAEPARRIKDTLDHANLGGGLGGYEYE